MSGGNDNLAPWELEAQVESELTGEWDDSNDPLALLIAAEEADIWVDVA